MSNNLNHLINKFEEEKSNLLQMIEESIVDSDFLLAYHYQNRLVQVNGELRTLNNLQDDLYDKKVNQKRIYGIYTDMIKSENDEILKRIWKDKINEIENNLIKLQETIKPKENSEIGFISDHIDKLLNDELKSFIIVVNQSLGFKIQILKLNEEINIVIPHISLLEDQYFITDKILRKFQNLGFEITIRDELFKSIQIKKSNTNEEIMKTLSIIFFHIFYYKEIFDQSHILQ